MKSNKEKAPPKKNALVKYKAPEIYIKFPENKILNDKEKAIPREAITEGGIVRSDGQTFIDKTKMPKLLNTDKKGVNKVYNDLEDDDKFEDGDLKYVDTSALIKEVCKRIQEPRPQLDREKLRDNRDCMTAFIDAPQLEKERSIESDRIKKELPLLTKKKIKAEKISHDQLTGEEFDGDAEGHHVERKADNPKRARDLENIIVIKEKTHDKVHKEDAEDKESLRKLAESEGWNADNIV